MRTTRAKALASDLAQHCIITRVPVEVVTQILKYEGVTRKELAAVAKTCRYLRAIVTPLLFGSMKFPADKKASFAPLEAIAASQEKGALVRTIDILEPEKAIPVARAAVFSGILVSALNVLSTLTSLSIPFALLDQATFDAIYTSPTIEKLSLSRIKKVQGAIDFGRRASLVATRSSPLSVPWVSCEFQSPASASVSSTACVESLLDFLDFHGVKLDEIMLSVFKPDATFGTFLTTHSFSTLTVLHLETHSRNFTKSVDWITKAMAAQPALETIWFTVTNFLHGFDIRDGLVGWIDGDPAFPIPATMTAWAGKPVCSTTLSLYRPDPTADFFPTHVELTLRGGTDVSSAQIESLVEIEPVVFSIDIHADAIFGEPGLGWSNWSSSVAAFLSHEYLRAVTFWTSVTPKPTITKTIACSSACYEKLLETHPALHAATELIGGRAALWTLGVTLNIERLRQLENTTQKHVLDVELSVFTKKGKSLAYFMGAVAKTDDGAEESRQLIFVDKGEPRPVEDKLRDCECFVCRMSAANRAARDDPISAIRMCGVQEVRAALAINGFDLDAFDNRPPTQPVDADSFETFLRSSA